MRLLAEEEYFDAWQFVPVLCLAMVFAAFSTFLSSVYVVLKKSSLSFWTVLLGAGSNVILTLILIPRIGVMGAALATLIGRVFAAVFILWQNQDLHNPLRVQRCRSRSYPAGFPAGLPAGFPHRPRSCSCC